MANKKGKAGAAHVRIKLVRSPLGYPQRQRATLRALGLRKMNQTVEMADNAVLRGMIAKVSHLVTVEEA